MMEFFKHFKVSIIFALVVYAALYIATGTSQLLVALSITAVEIAVSFDNAVMNAAKLKEMNRFWKTTFLWLGMLVAVGFMRFYLPLEIVAQLGNVSLGQAYDMAVGNPEQFANILLSSKDIIAGAGGAFLLMAALHFFTDEDKDVHWFKPVEIPFQWLSKATNMGKLEQANGLVALGVAFLFYQLNGSLDFFYSAIAGIALFIAVEFLKNSLSALDDWMKTTRFKVLAGGFGTFIYLEVLDASFSFDGVVAAFAISTNIWAATAGLAVGAMAVRCLTIYMDKTDSLGTYRFLENGAFLAILALATSMFVGVSVHLPHWFIATASITCIGAAFIHSIIVNQAEQKLATA
uniref:DUF475 domain-containing protein n=1 Tax=Pseudomonas phage Cygsa01 TaxID=3138529 RepID=A0AAU6W536_9VIRU